MVLSKDKAFVRKRCLPKVCVLDFGFEEIPHPTRFDFQRYRGEGYNSLTINKNKFHRDMKS